MINQDPTLFPGQPLLTEEELKASVLTERIADEMLPQLNFAELQAIETAVKKILETRSI